MPPSIFLFSFGAMYKLRLASYGHKTFSKNTSCAQSSTFWGSAQLLRAWHIFHIRPHFQGTQFSQIALSKHFAETIFVDQEFRVYSTKKFCQLNFRGLLKSTKTTIIMSLKIWTYTVVRPYPDY